MATVRKRASLLTSAEQNLYRNGITQLIDSGFDGQLVALHGDMSHDQHGGMGAIGRQPASRPGTAISCSRSNESYRASIPSQAFRTGTGPPSEDCHPGWTTSCRPCRSGSRNPIQVRRSIGRRCRLPRGLGG